MYTRLGTATSLAFVLMTSVAHAAIIEGRVSDSTGEVSLEGAIVRLVEPGRRTTTEDDGTYRFSNVDVGTYTLTVSYLGAEPVSVEVEITDADQTVTQDVEVGLDSIVMDNILVIGQRGSITSAQNQERAADTTISVVSADAIGNFPDQNVSEALRRLPGLSTQNDQGEGRYVVIRGINPNLNSTSINGVRIPSPEGGDRQVALDVIDADVLSSVVVAKTLTPDMDGDAIGGSVNIKTLSAFERDGAFLRIKAQGSYNNLATELGQGFAVTASDIFLDGRLGIAGAVSWRERTFDSDNLEAGGDWDRAGAIFFNEELELRNYEVERERLNAILNVDFELDGNTTLYARSIFSDFRDTEFRNRVTATFEDGFFDEDASRGTITLFRPGEIDGEEFALEYVRDVRDREETQRIISVAVGGQTVFDKWTFDYSASYSHSEEEEPDRLNPEFALELEDDEGLAFGQNTRNTLMPRLAFGSAQAEAVYLTASNYEFNEVEALDGITEDDELAFTFDVRRDMRFGEYDGYVKAGAKARLREKTRDVDVKLYDGFDGDDLLLSQFQTEVRYPLDSFGPAPDPVRFRNFFENNLGQFELSESDSIIDSAIEDYEANEDIYAGYVMASTDIDALRIVYGVRIEHTMFDSTAREVLEADEGAVVDGEVLGDDTVFISNTFTDQEYTDILPSINARYEATEDLILRASYFRSVIRPNIEAIVPAAAVEQNDEDEIEAELGNPNIDRQIADNFDIGAAWYFQDNAVLQAGVFYKTIQDFIAVQTFEDFTLGGITYNEATINVNLDDASLFGVEVSYQQALEFLPAPLDGLLIGFNYAYIDGEATLADGRTVPLPGQSEQVGNLVIGYDKDGLDIRAALTYRDEYIDDLNEFGDGLDRIVDDHLQFDVSARYQLTDRFSVFAEAINITNEPFVAFTRIDGRELLSQFEEYSYSVRAGVKYTY